MKKKIVLALTAAALSMCLITGCGTSSNIAPESTKTIAETPATAPKPVKPPTYQTEQKQQSVKLAM
ncbi:MAG: hypothetical protein J6J86_05415 [Lachnospiraceae bacterium]|nr:hypothetical protein [Lachnospiraceae bacterium]